jgi:putative endonuclease
MSAPSTYHVYLLECADGSIYTGITTDLARRFAEHTEGIGSRYTRSRKPVRILYSEESKDRSSAQKREAEIKGWPRARKLALGVSGMAPRL